MKQMISVLFFDWNHNFTLNLCLQLVPPSSLEWVIPICFKSKNICIYFHFPIIMSINMNFNWKRLGQKVWIVCYYYFHHWNVYYLPKRYLHDDLFKWNLRCDKTKEETTIHNIWHFSIDWSHKKWMFIIKQVNCA